MQSHVLSPRRTMSAALLVAALAAMCSLAPTRGIASPSRAAAAPQALPDLSIGDVSFLEGSHGGANFANLTVSLSGASPDTVRVDFESADGTAMLGDADYPYLQGTVTFAPGETTQILQVGAYADTNVEPDESYAVQLSNAVGATVVDADGVVTILTDDFPPTLSIGNAAFLERSHGGSSFANLGVMLSSPSPDTVRVDFESSDGTAMLGDADYPYLQGVVTFAPGETIQFIQVGAYADTNVEPDESYAVQLSNPMGAAIVDADAVVTILTDDFPPRLQISDALFVEGSHGGSNFADMTVSLTYASPDTVRVDYESMDATATLGDADYPYLQGSITFLPGETSHAIQVGAYADTKIESDEEYWIHLTNPAGAAILDEYGIATILSDDFAPRLFARDTSIVEGSHGGINFGAVTVGLTPASSDTVRVDYETFSATAAGGDYPYLQGTITFLPGETSQSILVGAYSDTIVEYDEIFLVDLSNAVGADIGDAESEVTIVNDDFLPALFARDTSLVEGNHGGYSLSFLTVGLSRASADTVRVDYLAVDGTATYPDVDYPYLEGTLVFLPGETSQQVPLGATADTRVEPDETYTIQLSNPTGADLADAEGVVTILDDDAPLGVGNSPVREFALAAITPNPVRDRTRIDYAVASRSEVRLAVLDVQGREVAVLASGAHEPGRYSVAWNGAGAAGRLPAGMYLARIEAGGWKQVRKFTLAR